MNLTMDEIVAIVKAESIYIDAEHPDHVSLQESDQVNLPFAVVHEEINTYYADGGPYLDESVWVMQIYTETEYSEAVHWVMERLIAAEQRPIYTREFNQEFSVYRHELRF